MSGRTFLDGKEALTVDTLVTTGDVTAGDDLIATDDLSVGDDGVITDDLDVGGTLTLSGVDGHLVATAVTNETSPVIDIKQSRGVNGQNQIVRIEADGSNWSAGATCLELISDDSSCVPLTCNNGSSDVFVVDRTGHVAINGNPTYTGATTVATTNNGNYTILPNGTGITIVGDAGSPNHLGTPTNDDLGVMGRFESQGITTHGDATNYAQFAADGELTLAGTARVTKKLIVPKMQLEFGGTAPNQTTLGNYLGYSYDINDDSIVSTELPVDWAAGTDVIIEADWYINEAYATANGEIQWQAAWSACPHDSSEAVDAPTHTGTVTSGDVNIPATAKHLTETAIGTISGASLAAGDEIGITFERIALVGGVDPTADPVVINFYLKYTADKLGTAT